MHITDRHSLWRTKCNCKYHIVFAPKYRTKVFYYEKRKAVGEILRKLCGWKSVDIRKEEVCPDYVHMSAKIPLQRIISYFMKKAYRMIEQFHELKCKYTNREFWCKGYYVDTVAKMQIIYRELREHLILQLEKENFFKGSK